MWLFWVMLGLLAWMWILVSRFFILDLILGSTGMRTCLAVLCVGVVSVGPDMLQSRYQASGLSLKYRREEIWRLSGTMIELE